MITGNWSVWDGIAAGMAVVIFLCPLGYLLYKQRLALHKARHLFSRTAIFLDQYSLSPPNGGKLSATLLVNKIPRAATGITGVCCIESGRSSKHLIEHFEQYAGMYFARDFFHRFFTILLLSFTVSILFAVIVLGTNASTDFIKNNTLISFAIFGAGIFFVLVFTIFILYYTIYTKSYISSVWVMASKTLIWNDVLEEVNATSPLMNRVLEDVRDVAEFQILTRSAT